ncbi:MAG TPA: transcription-repair coupling factor [Candidatus Acidoferrales bacterium]|jgi:transcription-repair coupling factor (superfamily II helicase)|nr:transcription-repair coupling factor [Candidatus Acidoferrales bacterium]
MMLDTLPRTQRLAEDLLATLADSTAWQNAIERMRSLRALPGRKPGVCALHETIAAARPALLAALQHALGGTLLVILPTPDAAERSYADLLYYLGEHSERVALLRSRDEALGAIESPSERSARITLLADLADEKARLILAPIAAVRQRFMARKDFEDNRLVLRSGDEPGWEQLIERLFRLGYTRCDVVSAVGEYAVRGGIVDLFAATSEAPVRIEFFGDRIESMRSFAIESQRSNEPVNAVAVAPWSDPYEGGATLLDYLPARAAIVLDEPPTIAAVAQALDEERARERHTLLAGDRQDEALLGSIPATISLEEIGASLKGWATLVFPGGIETGAHVDWVAPALESYVFECLPIEHFNRQIELFAAAMREWSEAGESIFIVSAAVSRTTDLLRAAGIEIGRRSRGGVFVDHGSIEAGFRVLGQRLRVLGDREIFGAPPKRVKIRAVKEGVPVTLADLRVGDYVVHAVHGIGQYLGLRAETILGATQDYLDLRYAGSDRMLVPVTQMHQIAKYAAAEGATPRLSKMGGGDWARTKSRVSESLEKIADELVAIYAEREMSRGFAFGPDTTWQTEMEEAFPYDPTPDQQKAIDSTKGDMEGTRPMDRLVCGDVGYGKTEVAMRAAFKAIADHKQVAVLVPTTLLADQHYRTFSARFGAFPVVVEELSRFTRKADQKRILADLAQGKVDVIIGTHRLLQKDVAFADLGLIVIDEEQRFGVMHKERLKEYRASVDVLTLSATPIPRTLHMSLMGVRDLSLIQTAPKNRMSIKTVVVPASDAIVQRAIGAELDRGGQVYYLHNRIESIYAVRNALEQLVPRARIGVGHGQMREAEIEPVMQRFIDGELDVLIATTIIENGIDIPNVNTMIVNDADRFGLAQLYQLRGRVGRSNHQAYCYLLYQGHKALTEDAKARLEAIREFAHLGSGLQIAMRDLEIRGAGNLLGAAQSGFIASVGFDAYCEMLAEAIAERRGAPAALEDRRQAVIDVKIDAFIPNDYISQVSQKIAVYQQLARARTEEEVDEVAAGVRDRFGALPPPLANLVELTKLRAIALRKHVTRVVVDERRLTLGVGSGFALDAAALPEVQKLTKNRFRFAEGRILVDLPAGGDWMALLRRLLEAI